MTDRGMNLLDTTPKKLTLADIAKRAGVSRSLASLALRGEPGVQPEKRERILAIAAELNYVPDPAARNLASNTTRTLGVIVSDVLNPFSASLAKAIDAESRRQGFDVLLSIDGFPDTAVEVAIEHLVRQRVAGLILIGTPEAPEAIARAGSRIPAVYVGRQLASPELCSVSNDDLTGARLLVEHLIEAGHRHIVHIDGHDGAGAQKRREGYTQTMEAHGLPARIVEGGYTLDEGAAGVDAALAVKPRPTAIFAANDLAAIGVINQLAAVGIRVPQDMAIVGYDDMPFARSEILSLTSMHQPIEHMAQESLRLLQARLHDPSAETTHSVLTPSLVVRRSCGSSDR